MGGRPAAFLRVPSAFPRLFPRIANANRRRNKSVRRRYALGTGEISLGDTFTPRLKPVLLTAVRPLVKADNEGMQMVLLGMACVLLALWGAGSVAHTWGHLALGRLASAPYAAAALIFLGMLFGPTRTHSSEDDEGEQKPGA